jgi:hypothetical protein
VTFFTVLEDISDQF